MDWSLHPTCLVSSEVPFVAGKGVRYHQEMHAAYHWRPPTHTHRVASFVNFADHMDCWPTTVRLWTHLMNDYEWSLFGGGMPEGVLQPTTAIADEMAASGWGLHDKVTGDGFGHVLWGWAAVGRPLIGHASYYKGKLGEVLWRDLETCIDLDQHSVAEEDKLIRDISRETARHLAMCEAIRAEVDNYYDPEIDARDIAQLLGA